MKLGIDIVCGLCIILRIVQQFVIEREIPGAGRLSDIQIGEIALRSLDTLNAMEPQIQWLHSYVTEDKVYCVYLAPEAESVHEPARRAGIPADRVSAVRRLIDPVNLKGQIPALQMSTESRLRRSSWIPYRWRVSPPTL